MKKRKNTIYYSATDLADYQRCSYHIINDIKNFEDPLPKKEITEMGTAYIKKGNDLEIKYINQLIADGNNVLDIKNNHETNKTELTLKSMGQGVDYIYQPHLKFENWIGQPDIIKKVKGKSKLGDYHYIPIDIKLSSEPKTKNITQVLVYCFLLSKQQDFMPDLFILVNGQDFIVNQFSVKDFIASFDLLKSDFEIFISKDNNKLYPEKCSLCNYECEWIDTCTSIWEKDRYLNLVANINKNQINKLKKNNIFSLPELASTDLTNIKGIGDQTFNKLKEQARLQLYKMETNENRFVVLDNIEETKGFNRLPKQNDSDLFFDIEGDPTVNQGLEYLLGIIIKNKNILDYKSFWAHNYKDEKIIFISLMNFFKSHMDNNPSSYIYHYSAYEISALKRLSIKYDECGDILDFLLRNKKFVDLYLVVKESIRISEPKYSIKNLETFYMKERTSDVQKGSDSVDMYIRWKETNNKKILEDIELYNKEDCISTKLLYDWLVKIKSNNFSDLIIENITEFQTTHDHRFIETKNELNKSKNMNKKFLELVSHSLEFYRRETKSDWWIFFNRQNYEFNDILNDMDAIGGLSYLDQVTTEDGYVVKNFKYPEQDFKFKPGATLSDIETLKAIGLFVDQDYKKNLVSIRLTKKSKGISNFINVSKGGPIRTDQLSNAIYNYADNVASKNPKFKAIKSILQKDKPHFKNNLNLETIVEKKELIEAIGEAIQNLDHSYLFIQGPPGTGKTYATAKTIHDLIKIGKKIAITSNSHKVIHNLLERIDIFSETSKLKYVGIKKSSSGNPESEYNSNNFSSLNKTTDTKNPDLLLIPSNTQIFAATKYELCKPIYSEKFDYIFIDEAGQISIADMIVSGMCAKNIILVGDPQQLPQPSQIEHPGELSLSVLEFLLDNRQTIPKNRGIFMEYTWRLNSSICNFISKSFYDGRLQAFRDNDKRKILDTEFLKIQSGILIFQTNHIGNTQKSEEEAALIKKIYDKIIGKILIDESGKRKIKLDDILTIAPYNVQVNHIKDLLPKDSRVGTIDRFQGQESAISILSMTSSEQENIPRGMDFLFSANRLNVAISRSRALSIVIMNEPLFNAHANSIDQLKLINNFSFLLKNAEVIKI